MTINEPCWNCGNPADKYSSGNPECWPCWNWRKMDFPAASHWAKVAEGFLSNIDLYDLSKFLPACGLSKEEIQATFDSVIRILDHSRIVVHR